VRVEIRDSVGFSHMIDSENPATIGLWFAEKAQVLMSANAATWQCQLIIYPMTDRERNAIGQPPSIRLTDKLLEDLATVINP
jgi:hypothetical protein